ncbi:hypothetical protein HanIR_Chr13g0648851 [Helianthus annuus]|nr:hypothetical protein HanIR_Chr13g0648851 [Helianthus annuus]
MLPTQNSKTQYMLLVVQNLKPLSASRGWETRHDCHFAYAANSTVPRHVATLDEMLVALWVVEAAYEWPNDACGCVDVLGYEGRACVGHFVEHVVCID